MIVVRVPALWMAGETQRAKNYAFTRPVQRASKVRWKVLVAWDCEAANAIAEILQARDLIAAM